MMDKRPKPWRRKANGVREGQRLRAAFDLVQRRSRELSEEREEAWREVADLRRALVAQTEQLEALTARVEIVTRREEELRAMLLDAHDQLMRHAEKIKADLAAELQLLASQHGAFESHSVSEVPAAVHLAESNVAANTYTSPQQSGKYLDYPLLVSHIQEVAKAVLPQKATVVVVSKGDEELLKLGDERRGWHFPQNEDGVYAGYYPADSFAAISHLEELRSSGADFLLFPETAFWWLERYEDFKQHLEARYQRVWGEGCIIYQLHESRAYNA
jgi:hypothetical protein